MAYKILVVEDDVPLTRTIDLILREAGYSSLIAHTAEDGLRMAIIEKPHVALLDVMVPTMGGWELCRQLRSFTSIPIIFLTALGNTENVVRGLEMGADDYIVKPFQPQELLARVKAHLRRSTVSHLSHLLVFGNQEFVLDTDARTVQVRGKIVDLTPREYDLLSTLAQSAGKVIPTNELVRRAWGINDPDAVANIKPYVHYLRKKIEEDPAFPKRLLTVRGVGYRFSDE